MEVSKKILTYLLIYGKENKYRLASALKISDWEVTKALTALEEEGKIEIEGGRAILVKGEKPITAKTRKRKKQPKAEEEQPEETETKEETPVEGESEEGQQVETHIEEDLEKVSEEPTKEEVQETFEAKIEEKEEERIEGTVKFFNPNKGFGFIRGDNGEEYYVHKSALKEGVTIEANNRVSFKIVQGDKGPKAEEVEWVSQA